MEWGAGPSQRQSGELTYIDRAGLVVHHEFTRPYIRRVYPDVFWNAVTHCITDYKAEQLLADVCDVSRREVTLSQCFAHNQLSSPILNAREHDCFTGQYAEYLANTQLMG